MENRYLPADAIKLHCDTYDSIIGTTTKTVIHTRIAENGSVVTTVVFDTSKTLAQAVRQYRQAVIPSLSQEQVALRSDISTVYFQKIEQGKAYPSRKVLTRIGMALAGMNEQQAQAFANDYFIKPQKN